jgi:Lipoxygenase
MPKHRDVHAESSEEQAGDLQRSLAGELHTLELAHGDWHTRGVLRLMRQRYAEWNAAPPTPASLRVPTDVGPLDKVEVLPGTISVPVYDEDWGPTPLSKRSLHHVLRGLPITDCGDVWESPEEARRVVQAELASIEPLPSVEWSDKTSDRAIELIAFSGLGAHRLEPVEGDCDGARYVVDLSWMRGFPVRHGFEPYGAAAYFSASGKLLRIYTAHDDRHRYPGQEGWEAAKWRWKCSLFVGTTVTDHLGCVHLVYSNLMVTATREHLPPDHPIRRMLKPYEFRTVAINYDASLALAPEGGLAHRAFAFTYPGLVQCLLHGTRTARYLTFPQAMAKKQVDALGDRFPFATDGLALWRTIRAYVVEYVGLFHGPGELAADPSIRRWWQALSALLPSMGFEPLSQDAQVIDLLAQFMFTVSGFHEHVGGVAEYALDPAFMAGKIRPGQLMADVQASVQVLLLLAATGFRQPPLIGDYTHLFLDRERAGAEAAFARYQGALKALSREIDERNRRRVQPFQSFNPALLQSSVSI